MGTARASMTSMEKNKEKEEEKPMFVVAGFGGGRRRFIGWRGGQILPGFTFPSDGFAQKKTPSGSLQRFFFFFFSILFFFVFLALRFMLGEFWVGYHMITATNQIFFEN